ncbi:hypothetical protein PJE062_1515 [Pseudovibrio sp. JE062]|nr:hypothetical protein PJE062_1515 [Pseudovibrio sp. JE062]
MSYATVCANVCVSHFLELFQLISGILNAWVLCTFNWIGKNIRGYMDLLQIRFRSADNAGGSSQMYH